jgi:2-oxoglutarate ferredoxin oxidoreductase subunit gamma
MPGASKQKVQIRLAGFGGQGIILAGYILGKAAAIFEKRHAVLTQSYGPEARGGACSADVVISDSPIHYPKVSAPDILAAMSEEAFHTFSHGLARGGILLTDSVLVQLDEQVEGVETRSFPATRLAEQLGRRIVANMVMLGFLTGVTGLVSPDAMREAIKSSVPAGMVELNLNAFDQGLEQAKQGGAESASASTAPEAGKPRADRLPRP